MNLLRRASQSLITSSRMGVIRRGLADKVLVVKGTDVNTILKKEGGSVLYFTATWCPPCKQFFLIFFP
jgi:thiol-disulfide isomerase/thioredoxin